MVEEGDIHELHNHTQCKIVRCIANLDAERHVGRLRTHGQGVG